MLLDNTAMTLKKIAKYLGFDDSKVFADFLGIAREQLPTNTEKSKAKHKTDAEQTKPHNRDI